MDWPRRLSEILSFRPVRMRTQVLVWVWPGRLRTLSNLLVISALRWIQIRAVMIEDEPVGRPVPGSTAGRHLSGIGCASWSLASVPNGTRGETQKQPQPRGGRSWIDRLPYFKKGKCIAGIPRRPGQLRQCAVKFSCSKSNSTNIRIET
jgi:hypothetical protein